MTKLTEEYIKASELLERLINQDFSLIEEIYCEEIADQLYEDFMKDRAEEDGCCVVNDIEKIKKLLTMQQMQIASICRILKNSHPLTKDDAKMTALEDALKELIKLASA